MNPVTIHLISGPRNISTALMYSFAQRSDTSVVDEPFYGIYLAKTGLLHPGREDVMRSQPTTESEVIAQFRSDKPVLFIKNMAHHIEQLTNFDFSAFTTIFLIRDPAYIITSYTKVIESPTLRDIGLEYQFKLFHQLTKHSSNNPIVIDSGLLLQDPRSVLIKLCEVIGISFQESMLRWQPGPKPYDGSWASYWYNNVHQSSGFDKAAPKQISVDEKYLPLYIEAKKYYDQLIEYAINP